METQILKEAIENSELTPMRKGRMIGFITSYEEYQARALTDRKLVEQVSGIKNLDEVVFSGKDVKIYTVLGRNDEWDTKYPFRSIYYNSERERWERTSVVSPSLDLAFLVYLEYKHLGPNSRFTDFAIKMLEIKLED